MFTILYETLESDYSDCIGTYRTMDDAVEEAKKLIIILEDKQHITFEEAGDNMWQATDNDSYDSTIAVVPIHRSVSNYVQAFIE